MKILHCVCLLLIFCFLFYGCTPPAYTPVLNTVDITEVDFSKPMKSGEHCDDKTRGNIGIAARNGGISKVSYVGYRGNCIIVYGE